MKHRARLTTRGVAAAMALAGTLFLAGCNGGGRTASGKLEGSGVILQSVEYGRLVDVYSYRRVEPARADRRDSANRTAVLVAKNVVINPSLEGQELFDAVGEENDTANFRFLPFDVNVGHEELLILWDNQLESSQFDAALTIAQGTLKEVPGAHRGQNTAIRPMPVVPRNAAIKLTFDEDPGLSAAFFLANPTALQVLEFRGDPATLAPSLAFRPVRSRVIPQGNSLIVDTSLIGGESRDATTAGLPASSDQVTANIRIAIPVNGLGSADLNIEPDVVDEFNGVDANGDEAVIRDFRAGNANDVVGALADSEAPSIVAHIDMDITKIEFDNPNNPLSGGVITLDKRGSQVAIRGRVPFVDGGLDTTASLLPGGPGSAPATEPLRSGDFIFQDVETPSGEIVRVRAEIIQNEDVANQINQPGFPGLGLTTNNTDGGELGIAKVRVASLVGGVDSAGNPVQFQPSGAAGRDVFVKVHYYHNIPYTSGQTEVSDSNPARMKEFLIFDPDPPLKGSMVRPVSSVGMRFSEPLDLTVVQSHDNFLLSTDYFKSIPNQVSVEDLLREPKATSLSVLVTRLVDQEGDATHLRLFPPLGMYHEGPSATGPGKAETYWIHVLTTNGGPTDLAGNIVDLYDRRVTSAESSFSTSFTLDPNAPDNLVGSRVFRFESIDEDGTPAGSADYFGQFGIGEGRLSGAQVQRFSGVTDQQSMSSARMARWNRGECFDDTQGLLLTPGESTAPFWGSLYLCPTFIATQPAPFVPKPWVINARAPVTFGGILEPHNPRGSRLQMTYREDDFGLEHTESAQMNIDIEQLHWSPWNNSPVQFDSFDRVTIEAAHADVRPDLNFHLICNSTGLPPPCNGMETPTCNLDCASMVSGLSPTFAQNVLNGTEAKPLVVDEVYQANPNSAFKNESTQLIFVPYAKFQNTYTWRDSRLVSWDTATNRATGLGGSKQPDGTPPARDRTAFISSPWIQEEFPQPAWATMPGANQSVWTVSNGDFRGDRVRDHDPIAMPLLLDFKVYADDPANGVASGVNSMHIGYVGPCWFFPPGGPIGYYNFGPLLLCGADWPYMRVHTSGGIDGGTQTESLVLDPANVSTATGGWIFDVGLGDLELGLYRAGPADNHVAWAQADFVRRVSLVTFGFFDTLLPNQHGLDGNDPTQSLTTTLAAWPGLADKKGLPDLETLAGNRSVQYGASDFVAVTDPPLSAMPAGTSVTLEFRGADSFKNDDLIYHKADQDNFPRRGNILNPNYACEAYRHAMPNSGTAKNVARIDASGLTPYVEADDIDQIRDPFNDLLPRLLNMRIVMENDIVSNPPVSPSLRSVGLVFRVGEK